ncbi:MAG: hypothetical protein R3259_12865, partial [Salinimicrobium sediminis]|nr:hypothetical protein [Salinimicrobium sediminis]
MDDMTTEQVEEGTVWEDETDTTTWETENDSLGTTEQGVQGYLAYIDNDEKMGIDHQYTNNAIIELMNAVQAKADEINYDISADMQAVRADAQAIQQDPMALNHANRIKSVGTKLAEVMEKMQKDKFPNLSQDVTEVKTAAQNINATTPTLDQKDQIKKFFDEAGDVLEKMS